MPRLLYRIEEALDFVRRSGEIGLPEADVEDALHITYPEFDNHTIDLIILTAYQGTRGSRVYPDQYGRYESDPPRKKSRLQELADKYAIDDNL